MGDTFPYNNQNSDFVSKTLSAAIRVLSSPASCTPGHPQCDMIGSQRDENNNTASRHRRENWKKVRRLLTLLLQRSTSDTYVLSLNFTGLSAMEPNLGLPDVVQDVNYLVPLRNEAIEIGRQLNQIARAFDLERGHNRPVALNELAHEIVNGIMHALGIIFLGLRP